VFAPSLTCADNASSKVWFHSLEAAMENFVGVRVKYVAATKRAEVTCGDRRVSIPGKHETSEKAMLTGETYAQRYLGIKLVGR
jgi:hypothetical protein